MNALYETCLEDGKMSTLFLQKASDKSYSVYNVCEYSGLEVKLKKPEYRNSVRYLVKRNNGGSNMKVLVHATYRVIETFEIEVGDESEIRDKAWDYAYDFTSKYGCNEPCDVDWENLEEGDED